jgi:hypothetical protein
MIRVLLRGLGGIGARPLPLADGDPMVSSSGPSVARNDPGIVIRQAGSGRKTRGSLARPSSDLVMRRGCEGDPLAKRRAAQSPVAESGWSIVICGGAEVAPIDAPNAGHGRVSVGSSCVSSG